MKKYGSDWNIAYLGRKKILDIEEASIEELQEAEEEVTHKLEKLITKKNKENELVLKTAVPVFIVEGVLIYLAARYLFCNLIDIPKFLGGSSDAKQLVDVVNGLGTLFAVAGINLGTATISYDKYINKKDKLEKSKSRIKYKIAVKETEKRGTQELEGLAKILTESIELDKYQEHLKQMVIEDLLEKGADPKILNFPVIQNIISYELNRPVPEPMQRRAFSYSPDHREIREDGTFDIAPCIKDYKYSFPVKIDYERYVIKYCEEPTEEYYLVIHCPDPKEYYLKEYQKIYLDKDGNITEITKEKRSTLLKYPVNVSIKSKTLVLKES